MVSSTGFHAALCMLQRLGLEEVVFGQHAGRCISASPLAAPLQATLRALLVPPPQQPPRALHQLNPTTDPAVVFASHLMPMNPFVADLPPAACAVTTKQHAKVLREFKTAVESVRSATWAMDVLQNGGHAAALGHGEGGNGDGDGAGGDDDGNDDNQLAGAFRFAKAIRNMCSETEKVCALGCCCASAENCTCTCTCRTECAAVGTTARARVLTSIMACPHGCSHVCVQTLRPVICEELVLPRKLLRRIAHLQTAALALAALQYLPMSGERASALEEALAVSDSDGRGSGGGRPAPSASASFSDAVVYGLWLHWVRASEWDTALLLSCTLDGALVSLEKQDHGQSDGHPADREVQRALASALGATRTSDVRRVAFRANCVDGDDIMAAGVKPGADIGTALAAAKVVEIAALYGRSGNGNDGDASSSSSLARRQLLAWLAAASNQE